MSRNAAALAGVLLLLGATTACGAIESLMPEEENDFAKGTPKEVFTAARSQLNSLESVHVTGSITDKGDAGTLDLSVARSGECTGTLGVKAGRMDLLVADKRVFFRPDEAFYRQAGQSPEQAAQTVATVGDRWIEDKTKKAGSVCDFKDLFDISDKGFKNLRTALPGKVSLTEGEPVAGVETVTLWSTGPKGSYTIVISSEEPHNILRGSRTTSAKVNGTLTYTDHDIPVDTQVPPADQIFRP